MVPNVDADIGTSKQPEFESVQSSRISNRQKRKTKSFTRMTDMPSGPRPIFLRGVPESRTAQTSRKSFMKKEGKIEPVAVTRSGARPSPPTACPSTRDVIYYNRVPPPPPNFPSINITQNSYLFFLSLIVNRLCCQLIAM